MAIEQFVAGNKVFVRKNEHDRSGPVVLKVVEAVFVREGLIWELVVAGRVIRTTAEHPFDELEKGWTAVNRLAVGDKLRCRDGSWVVVEAIRDTGEWETVYNLRVADYHTYFVSGQEWGFAVWVHNDYIPKLADGARIIGGKTVKEWAKLYVRAAKASAPKRPSWSSIAPGTAHQGSSLTRVEQRMIRKWAEAFKGAKPKVHNPAGGVGDAVSKGTITVAVKGLKDKGYKANQIIRDGRRIHTPQAGAQKSFRTPDAFAIDPVGKRVTIVQSVRTSNKLRTTPLSREPNAMTDILQSPYIADLLKQGYTIDAHMIRRGAKSLDSGTIWSRTLTPN